MAQAFKDGDRVQVVDREANAADVKSSLFYNHYRGLVGTVQKVYETTDDIAVTVDEDSSQKQFAPGIWKLASQ